MSIITIDFETYYTPTYSLSKMTPEAYIRDDQFEVVGVSVMVDGGEPQWFSGTMAATEKFLAGYDWGNSIAIAHNAAFDMAILNWHFDIRPKRIVDTLSVARALHGVELSLGLAALVKHYQLGEKGTEVVNAISKRRKDFTPGELARYGDYCINDTTLTYGLFEELSKGFPLSELKLIDLTIRMFTEPVLVLDVGKLEAHLINIKQAKEELLGKALLTKENLMSNPKLAETLTLLGVEIPMKISPTTGKETYAFAKTDEGFKALLEHESVVVQAIVAARLGVKSTLEETRTERFIQIGGRGTLPVPLKYYGAHTGRWSAEGSVNLQNIPRTSPLKYALKVPEGYSLINCDSSQIECVSGSTLILTAQRGYVKITDVNKTDRLWDGVEWVEHDGVIYKGLRRVITYGGITGTPNHVVYTADGRRIHLADAAHEGAALAVGERGGEPVRFMGGNTKTNPPIPETKTVGAVPPLWAGVFSSVPRHEEWQIARLQRIASDQPVLRQYTKGSSASLADEVLPYTGSNLIDEYQQSVCYVQEARDKEPILQLRGVREAYMGDTPAPQLQRAGGGSDRQQRALREGQFAAGDTGAERPESVLQHNGDLSGRNDERAAVPAGRETPMSPHNCKSIRTQGRDSGGNYVAVYDVVNAGPRHRFTANGVIISNCRVLAWLAGQDDLVEAFDRGEDVYKIMASSIYEAPVEDITKDQRHVGKVVVLGAGYGLGAAKFTSYAKQQNINVTDEEAQRIISVYRETYPQIPKLWAQAGEALTAMMRDASAPLGKDGVLVVDGRDGVCLPNDLYIRYPNLRKRKNEEGRFELVYDVKKGRSSIPTRIYGGKCLAADTEVLTPRGWLPITDVTTQDRVWDGVEWVKHSGLAHQGDKATLIIDGVRMTPDHEVLTERGWRCASSCEGLYRASFWMPNGSELRGDKRAAFGGDTTIDPKIQVAPEAVYDIRNAGPRSRFVVRGTSGPFIVHNCVENICQALARIIVGEQMLMIARRYKVVMTVHDSVVPVVKDEELAEALVFVQDCMRMRPSWALGLPLNCEAGYGHSYGDC